MSQLKYCQGVKCHTYKTKDRLRGTKGNKFYQTRRRSSFYYLGGNACSLNCQDDWFRKFGDQALNHFGRITEPRVLTKDNAWSTRRDWSREDNDTFYVYNYLTQERHSITEQQYDDETSITSDGRLNI